MASKADFKLSDEHEEVLTGFLAAITTFRDSLANREQSVIESETAFLKQVISTTLSKPDGNHPRQLPAPTDTAPVPDETNVPAVLPRESATETDEG